MCIRDSVWTAWVQDNARAVGSAVPFGGYLPSLPASQSAAQARYLPNADPLFYNQRTVDKGNDQIGDGNYDEDGYGGNPIAFDNSYLRYFGPQEDPNQDQLESYLVRNINLLSITRTNVFVGKWGVGFGTESIPRTRGSRAQFKAFLEDFVGSHPSFFTSEQIAQAMYDGVIQIIHLIVAQFRRLSI